MIVSHEHRFIFMKTLKTAGTSVEIALSRVMRDDAVITRLPARDERLRASLGGRPPQNVRAAHGDLGEHLTARVARDRLGHDLWDGYAKIAIQRNPWDAVVSLYYWVNRHDRALTFEQFLELPNVAKLALRNTRITHVRGRPAMDHVLRFERLSEDLQWLWSEHGLPGEPALPRAKGAARPVGADYREHYDARTRELVRREFALLIEECGYEF